MQIGSAHSDRRRDSFVLGLGAPVLGEKRNGTAYDVIVGGGASERGEVGNAVGREHGGLHHRPPT